jgi:hypothetical protein
MRRHVKVSDRPDARSFQSLDESLRSCDAAARPIARLTALAQEWHHHHLRGRHGGRQDEARVIRVRHYQAAD